MSRSGLSAHGADVCSLPRAFYPKAIESKTREHEISCNARSILFWMFGDDTEMWEPHAYRRLQDLSTTRSSPMDPRWESNSTNCLFRWTLRAHPEARRDFPMSMAGSSVNGFPILDLDKEFRDALQTRVPSTGSP